ncbi:unnamed protein product [Penicillium olsonii]|nr:unnamed protein product [Penicillium olsonii]CAG7922372.1 unnamed protein product [Penicillium olsonii]
MAFSYSPAPPVRPSRSLDGLERVVPPHHLGLNKPLPARPEESAMWSDSDSATDSFPSEPRNSADSYPIFVGDFDLTDQAADLTPLPPLKCTDAIDIVIDDSIPIASSFDSPDPPAYWAQQRTGANHYFREKKWDYFPELAPSTVTANMNAPKSRKKGSALEIAKGKYRWHSLDRGGLYGVRDSIKTYMHRTLSRDGEPKREISRPETAPMDHHLSDASSVLGPKGWEPHQQSLALDTDAAMRVSVSTSPGAHYDYTKQMFHLQTPISPTFSTFPPSPVSDKSPTTPRQKQLAVPLSPYQKHGPAIWESPKKSKSVQSPNRSSPTEPSSSSAPELSFANASSSPPLKQLQQNTRGVFMGAKRKIAESKEDRRREQLKSQIKLIGPVNPHTYAQSDPWV